MGAGQYSNFGVSPSGLDNAIVLVAPGGDLTEDWDSDGLVDGVYQQSFKHFCLGGPPDLSAFRLCDSAGTSMASPHVAGVPALVLSVNPGLTAAGVYDILTSTATDLGTSGYDSSFGFGEINAAAAVAAAQDTLATPTLAPSATQMPTSTPPPVPTATPMVTATPGQGCPPANVGGSNPHRYTPSFGKSDPENFH